MKRIIILGVLLIAGILLFSYKKEKIVFDEYSRLSNVLIQLGDKKALHYIDKIDTNLAHKGEEIVIKGRTIAPNGKKSKLQSKYFTCVDCHNVVAEDPNLRKSDPEARLKMAVEKNIPFLSATTFYGMVNREHWYNDDYQVKYGDLVKPAKDTLKNAIHLCTVECSQGRAFEDWEMEAVMHYFNRIGYKLKDLKLSASDYKKLNTYKENQKNEALIKWLKSYYLQYSPATFLDPLPWDKRGYGKNGNAENGKLIYEKSCMHCHATGRVTNFTLDQDKIDLGYLKKTMRTDKHSALYNIVRKGTYALPGYRPYMPNYTLERLSHQQLEDLAAYINSN